MPRKPKNLRPKNLGENEDQEKKKKPILSEKDKLKLAEIFVIGDITDIESGMIMHQVNCQNAMGSGVAKAIYTKWPEVKERYHRYCENVKDDLLLGKLQEIKISDDLTIFNSYSQKYYGNSEITGKKYTDRRSLIVNLIKLDIISNRNNMQAYVPYKIGCGLAGDNWEEVAQFIAQTTNNVKIVILPELVETEDDPSLEEFKKQLKK